MNSKVEIAKKQKETLNNQLNELNLNINALNEQKNAKLKEIETQISQTIEANPKNESNQVMDQNEPDKASNSNTNPEDGKQLFIPKGFTPNSDGINDQFFVIADWEVDNFEILIFNRGGGLVFKSSDIHQGWDGTDNNVEVSQGVYVYKILYKDQNGNDKIVKGTLTLIR